MRKISSGTSNGYAESVKDFFDHQYRLHPRYWWSGDNRYSLDPAQHTPFHAAVLRLAMNRKPGRVLDIGAGEGADAIRLAKLGYSVDAVDLSAVACEKIHRFAREEGVRVNIYNESILTTALTERAYDIVLMNGSLHYIAEKSFLLEKLRRASAPMALHVVSLFSTATPIPSEHAVVPVFPVDEQGVVESFYNDDRRLGTSYVRGQKDSSHPGFSEHAHSFIKFIVALPE